MTETQWSTCWYEPSLRTEPGPMTQYLLIFKTSEDIRHLSCMIMTHSLTRMCKATHVYTSSLLLLLETEVEVLKYIPASVIIHLWRIYVKWNICANWAAQRTCWPFWFVRENMREEWVKTCFQWGHWMTTAFPMNKYGMLPSSTKVVFSFYHKLY